MQQSPERYPIPATLHTCRASRRHALVAFKRLSCGAFLDFDRDQLYIHISWSKGEWPNKTPPCINQLMTASGDTNGIRHIVLEAECSSTHRTYQSPSEPISVRATILICALFPDLRTITIFPFGLQEAGRAAYIQEWSENKYPVQLKFQA